MLLIRSVPLQDRSEPIPRLLAIGGGGFTLGTYSGLDQLVLNHCMPNSPIGYLGTASNDDQERISRFYDTFQIHEGTLCHLTMQASREDLGHMAAKD